MEEQRTHRLGLVLGGGGARGLCHVGVWRVLDEEGIRPDVLAGTSMGGLVAAFIAAGHDADAMDRIVREISWPRMLNWSVTGRIISTTRFREWLARYLPETFEELDVPLVLTATDIVEGQTHYLHTGDLRTALQATVAYPGALDSVRVGDAVLVDGGVLNQIPVDGARFLGADRIIAVNATALEPLQEAGAGRRRTFLRSTVTALREAMRAVDIMQTQLSTVRLALYRPDVLIDPHIGGVEQPDFHKSAQAIAAGERATRDMVDELRALVGTAEQ